MRQKNISRDTYKDKAILAATVRLLASHGVSNITMDAIAREAGVAKGTLFLYYPSKQSLFAAAHEQVMETLGRRLAETLSSGLRGEALLKATVSVLLDHSAKKRDISINIGKGEVCSLGRKSFEEIKARITSNLERITEILRLCQADGLVKLSADPLYDAAALFGFCRSVVTVCKATGRAISPQEMSDKVIAIYLGGVGMKK